MGWSIVSHSFTLLFRNLNQAFRVSIAPYLIGIVACLLIATALGLPVNVLLSGGSPSPAMMQTLGFGAAFAFLLCMLVLLFVSAWVAVSWHRYVLLEEEPATIPAISDRPIMSYVGKSLLLSIVVLIALIPISFILGLAFFPLIGDGTSGVAVIVGTVLGIIIGAVLATLWLRLGLILPSTAVERPLTMGESWNATKPMNGAIISAALILIGITILVTTVLEQVLGANIVSGILNLVVNWISVMVGISILTTIYGVAVEGRSIA